MSKTKNKIVVQSLSLFLLFLSYASLTMPLVHATTYTYSLHGMYDEDFGGGIFLGPFSPVSVTAYYKSIPASVVFIVNGTYLYNTTELPEYFQYDLGNGVIRQYWLSVNETGGNLYVFNCTTIQTINVYIRYLGSSATGDLLTVKRNVNGYTQAVEKRPVDSNGYVSFELKPNTIYSMSLSNGQTYTFNQVSTWQTPITLLVNPLNFPSNIVEQYKYVRMYAYRASTSVLVNYLDLTNHTLLSTWVLKLSNGTIIFTSTNHTGLSVWQDNLTGLNPSTAYYLQATILTSIFGTTTYSQILVQALGTSSPFGLGFLGNWHFTVAGVVFNVDSAQLIPALFTLFIFCCFSVLNAYIGLFFAICAEAVEMWNGWFTVPTGVIVGAFAIFVLVAIAYAKRRSG